MKFVTPKKKYVIFSWWLVQMPKLVTAIDDLQKSGFD